MTPEQFCYWLKGYFELLNADPDIPAAQKLTLSVEQVAMIHAHLKSVFAEKIMIPPVLPVNDPNWGQPAQQQFNTGTPLPEPPYRVTC